MRHPNNLMLLRICQADAYGMATEFLKLPHEAEVLSQALKFEGYLSHPRHKNKAGRYGDDGQMSIAVAETLLQGPPYTPIKFVESFVTVFKRDPRPGYARNFYDFLVRVKTGSEFLEKIKPVSEKIGAAMRSVPLGVLSCPELVLDVAVTQAQTTHNTEVGILSSQVVALLSHFALYEDASFQKAFDYCYCYIPEIKKFLTPNVASISSTIKMVSEIFNILASNDSLEEMLKTILRLGGDTDTLAAMVWGIASSRLEQELPVFWEENFEVGRLYGAEYLKELSYRLMVLPAQLDASIAAI